VNKTASEAVRGLDLQALSEYLRYKLPRRFSGALTAELLTGGLSNLTFRLTETATGRTWVLRRPPLGHVLPTAHDMRREYRVMRALYQTRGPVGAVPVPRPYLLCQDESVIGAPFYVMSDVHGTIYREKAASAALTPPTARAVSTALINTLTALHALDPRAVGLADFGRPDGYLMRQLDRWDRQYAASASRELPGLAELARRLRASVPTPQRAAVLHGDYRLDNLIYTPEAPVAILAVLDWEMSTLGDPLADFGLLLTYWEDPGTPDKPMVGGLTNHPGFHQKRELATIYAARTGLDLSRLDWYVAFNHYKLAVILEGIYYRHRRGLTYGSGFERAGRSVPVLVNEGLAALG
jgi:aminoglycoside phosphotransferase (APT) family kinase protein